MKREEKEQSWEVKYSYTGSDMDGNTVTDNTAMHIKRKKLVTVSEHNKIESADMMYVCLNGMCTVQCTVMFVSNSIPESIHSFPNIYIDSNIGKYS